MLQQPPISDLMITMSEGDLEQRGQTPIDGEYEGLIALGPELQTAGSSAIPAASPAAPRAAR